MRRHGGRLFLFSLVGVLNTAVDFAVYAAAIAVGVSAGISNILAFAVANPVSYVVNARVTFRENKKPAQISFSAYGKFLTAHLFSLLISTVTVILATPLIGPYLAKAVAIVITLAINYSTSAFLVFKHKVDKEERL
jgi:putative flippase GtrA